MNPTAFRTLLCALVSTAVFAVSLQEPPESGAEAYWGTEGKAEAPFAIPRFEMSGMTRELFDSMVRQGKAFIVMGVGESSPMKGWSCDTFQKDPDFSKAEMQQMYAQGGGAPYVGFKSDWRGDSKPSGAQDAEAPKKAPFYWGIKDVQYNDGSVSRTWKKSMLDKVRKHTAVPGFMDPRNVRDLQTTPEFWFANQGAGAKAHMDTHIQTTMSLQLASSKRWRLGFMPARQLQHFSMIYHDGSVYTHGNRWVPTHDVVLHAGEALFVPPGFIHETNNVGEGCAASVTYQFSYPMATTLYRSFLQRVRRTPDIWEVWPVMREWATLGLHGKNVDGEPLGENEGDADRIFTMMDRDGDGLIAVSELQQAPFERARAADVVAFHDTNGDGVASRDEVHEGYQRWLQMEEDAMDEKHMPKLGQEFDPQELQYEMLEDLSGHPRFEKKLRTLQKKTLDREAKMVAASATAKSDL